MQCVTYTVDLDSKHYVLWWQDVFLKDSTNSITQMHTATRKKVQVTTFSSIEFGPNNTNDHEIVIQDVLHCP